MGVENLAPIWISSQNRPARSDDSPHQLIYPGPPLQYRLKIKLLERQPDRRAQLQSMVPSSGRSYTLMCHLSLPLSAINWDNLLTPWIQQTDTTKNTVLFSLIPYRQQDFTNSLLPFPFYLPRPVPVAACWPKVKPDVAGLKGWLNGDVF
jgi:hypothetical protein